MAARPSVSGLEAIVVTLLSYPAAVFRDAERRTCLFTLSFWFVPSCFGYIIEYSGSMDDTPKLPSLHVDPGQVRRDRARIQSEIDGTDGGFDPFSAAVRATRMPMVITDPRKPDNPIVFANPSFCRLSGYSREEIVGRNCRFLQGPETDPAAVAKLREAIATPRSIEIDIRNHRKDGSPFWNRLLMAPVRDANGDLAYFFASQLDVTVERERLGLLEDENAALTAEREANQRQLQFSEESLRLATEAAEVGTWDLDIFSDVLTWSERTKAMFGISPNVPCHMDDFYAGLHPDDRETTTAAFAFALDPCRRATYDVEYRTVGKEDGVVRWVAAKGRGLFDETGRCVRALGTAIDITARKRVEMSAAVLVKIGEHIRDISDPDALTFAAAETLGRALGISRAGYGTIDLQQETIAIERDWNAPGVVSLAGTLRFRDYGSYIEDLKRGETVVFADAETDPRTTATAEALKAIDARSVVNMPITEQGGLVALLYLNNAEPRDWSGDDLGLVREVADRIHTATARLLAEHELRMLATSLEMQIEERTAAYLETAEQLRQSQKMEAVGQLTGGLAHDFNNLLSVVTGSLELLERRIAQGRLNDIERFTSAAQSAAKRASGLTHRLLAFSRRQTLDPKPTAINQLIADMDDLVRRTVGPQITLETVGAAGLWTARVDPNQLENALLNLCINARDAMPDGGRLTIETANRWLDDREAKKRNIPAGQYVSLSVSDTGCGMPPDVIAKAFDPFFTTKPLGQGTGLGLSMIYGFAQQSGGQVRIYSEVGHGTMVSIYLPRYHGDEAKNDEISLPAPSRAARGDTVLVVDDEPGVRMLIIEVLEELGYSAIEAADGPTALKVMQSNVRIDLLVTDVGLPGGLNGRQVADAGRAERPDLKVLFITGYAENAVIGNGHLDHGMTMLTKPFAVDMLAARIKELILQKPLKPQ